MTMLRRRLHERLTVRNTKRVFAFLVYTVVQILALDVDRVGYGWMDGVLATRSLFVMAVRVGRDGMS